MNVNNTIYETVIGLEVHIQLATNSKAFCGDSARFGGQPNTHTSPISLAHPGTLPRINQRQVEFAVRLGLSLGSEINQHNHFDRKNYFYPDLPKGYQITQDRSPICLGGTIHIKGEHFDKPIRIHHIHLEEDAGKSIHDADPHHTLIDLNRAGVPLLEMVTEPDFRSADEVATFMNLIRQRVRYLDISDGNMEEGSLRCDVNISLRKMGTTTFGERCEVKNLNSMRFARQAIAYEVERQTALLNSGKQVQRQTLHFDAASGTTSPLREKEDAHDYRYFPDPDLPPLKLSNEFIETIRQGMPDLPETYRKKFLTLYALPQYDADLLTQEKATADYFIGLCRHSTHHKAIANLVINKIVPTANELKVSLVDFPIPPAQIAEFVELIATEKVTAAIAYQRLFPLMMNAPAASALELAQNHNIIQERNEEFLRKIIRQVLKDNPKEVAGYRAGKKQLLGFFMGQIMHLSSGKAAPKEATRLLKEMLEEAN